LNGFVMLSWRDRERIKTEEVLRCSATQAAQHWWSIDYAKWGSLVVSIFALIVATSAFYNQTIREVHDFRAIDFGSDIDILLINAGNRTEALVEARFLYSGADWRSGKGGQLGEPTGPVVLKPGEAEIIHLLPIATDHLDDASLRTSRHISIEFLIVDTRASRVGNEVFLESVLGVKVIHEYPREGPGVPGPGGVIMKAISSAGRGPFDTTSYVQLYAGKQVEH
jgi:hypothetical protein